jgi:hypothetical protein
MTLVGLAVIPRTGQHQTAPLIQRQGDRLKRLAFPGRSLDATETSSPLTGWNRMISTMLPGTVGPSLENHKNAGQRQTLCPEILIACGRATRIST